MPRITDHNRTKAKQLLNRALSQFGSDELAQIKRGEVPDKRLSDQAVGAVRAAMAGYLMHTRDSRLPANSFGLSLKGIRAVLTKVHMDHYVQYIWTWDIQKKADRAAATV